MESVPSYLSYLRIDVNTVVSKLGLSLDLQFTTVTTVGADLIILGSTGYYNYSYSENQKCFLTVNTHFIRN